MLLASLTLFAATLVVLTAFALRGLSHIDDILEIDTSGESARTSTRG